MSKGRAARSAASVGTGYFLAVSSLRWGVGLSAVLMAIGLAAAVGAAAQGRGGRGQAPEGRGVGPLRRDLRPAADIPAGTAVVSGRVVVMGAGVPARRARVTLNAIEGGGSRSILTDDTGSFAFTGLAPGRYTLSASKTGHVAVTYGQTQPGRPGTPIQIADGEKFAANLQLPRGSVITGTVVDEFGEPAPGIQVRVMRYVLQAGRRTLQQSGGGATDDRGIYRAYGLQPGDFIVSAVPRNAGPGPDVARLSGELQALRERIGAAPGDGALVRELAARTGVLQAEALAQDEPSTGYAPVYYPGTTSPGDAAVVTLGLGEERAGIDFQLQRVATARVEGNVVNSTGQPAQNIQLTLSNVAHPVPGIGTMATRADTEGRFRFANVPPGVYRLVARANGAGPGRSAAQAPEGGRGGRGNQPAARMWGSIDVPVDGRDVSNVIVTLQQGLTVSGRIVFEGTTLQPPADPSRIRVNLAPADPPQPGMAMPPAAGFVDPAGKFTIPGVVPGVYRLTASGAGSGWALQSSIVDGQDTLDFPVEVKPGSAITNAVITLTDRQAQLSGALVDERGQPAPHFTLILFSADERFWGPQSRRIRSTRPATDGQFTFTGVPPGEYRLAALADAEPGSWFDPAFLQQLHGASIPVRLGEGEKTVQNIQVR